MCWQRYWYCKTNFKRYYVLTEVPILQRQFFPTEVQDGSVNFSTFLLAMTMLHLLLVNKRWLECLLRAHMPISLWTGRRFRNMWRDVLKIVTDLPVILEVVVFFFFFPTDAEVVISSRNIWISLEWVTK